MDKELTKLNQEFAKIQKAYRIEKGYIKADSTDTDPCVLESIVYQQDYMAYLIDNIASQINYLTNNFYSYVQKHSEGHIPPINGADKMQNALDKLGIGKDYDIIKPVIFANKNGNIEATVNFIKKK